MRLTPLLAIYRATAIVVLNTLLALIAAEAIATVLLQAARSPIGRTVRAGVTGWSGDLPGHYAALPYYAGQPWTAQYWREHNAALKKNYHAYVIWRSPAFEGDLLNIDPGGIRRTPGAACVAGASRIFVFGGSALWGWGAPDWGTIPAYLQRTLQARSARPMCVVNFAENAFVSTQSLIELILRLEAGDVPDAVIFYDGVNDVLAAHQSGRAVLHQNHAEIATRFQRDQHPLLEWASTLRVVTLAGRLVTWSGARIAGVRVGAASSSDIERIGQEVADTYVNTVSIVRALAASHGFEYDFFWQPHLLVGHKPLADAERAMADGSLDTVLPLDPALRGLFETTYARIATAAGRDEHLHYLGGIFDNEPAQIWIDTWGHLTPAGNALVAHAIAQTQRGEVPTEPAR